MQIALRPTHLDRVPAHLGAWRAWLVAAWLALVGSGLGLVWSYAGAPGDAAAPPSSWPAATSIARAPRGLTLVMLAHPRCPCTRASLRELDRLMARAGSALSARVLFTEPAGVEPGWARTDLWEHASSIPGVSVAVDPQGRAARAFGARTSGEVVVYDARGVLAFHGGITPARGHSGDSLGASAILELAAGGRPRRATPVFGCPLAHDEPPETAP